MARTCERCGVVLGNRKMRFCRKHSKEVLVEAEKAGYFQPLRVMTLDGPVTLAETRFLTFGRRPVPNSRES